MTPSFGRGRQDRVYRYYVSNPLLRGRALASTDGAIRRVPAGALEDLVFDRLQRIARRRHGELLTWDHITTMQTRIEIHASAVHLLLDRQALYGRPIDGDPDLDRLRGRLVPGERIAPVEPDAAEVRIMLPVRMKVRGGRTWLTKPDGGDAVSRAKVDKNLVRALRASHALVAELGLDAVDGAQKSPVNTYDRRLCALAIHGA